jgi:hypothetical protein
MKIVSKSVSFKKDAAVISPREDTFSSNDS